MTVWPGCTTVVGVLHPAPAHLADVQQTIDAAQIDEGAEVLHAADDALADLPLGQLGPELLAVLLAFLLQQRSPADDQVALARVDLGDQAAAAAG